MTKRVTESDELLARTASVKLAAGQTPTKLETKALRRYQGQRDREARERHYHEVTLADYQRMARLSRPKLATQGDNLGLSVGGPLVDLYVVLPELHALASGKRKRGSGAGVRAFVATVSDEDVSALDTSRAMVKFLVAQVAATAESGGCVSPEEVDAVKKHLQELRQAEADYVRLEEERGNLVPVAEVLAIVGESAARLVRCLEAVENNIATEFSLWLADPAVAAMGQDERARKIREYVAKVCRAVRQRESDDVRKLLADAKKEADDA